MRTLFAAGRLWPKNQDLACGCNRAERKYCDEAGRLKRSILFAKDMLREWRKKHPDEPSPPKLSNKVIVAESQYRLHFMVHDFSDKKEA